MKRWEGVDLDSWTYLFEFGCGLFIYAKGKQRIGVNKDGRLIVEYKAGPEKTSPRCKECPSSNCR